MVCDYGKAERPEIPFPYFAEVWTGFEYLAAAHMLYARHDARRRGVHPATSRARYDGEKRNPWDEAECGHHYARAMSAWSGVLALSGFRYHGGGASCHDSRRRPSHRCFWTTGTGWGTFQVTAAGALLHVEHGTLPVRPCTVNGRKSYARRGRSAKARTWRL